MRVGKSSPIDLRSDGSPNFMHPQRVPPSTARWRSVSADSDAGPTRHRISATHERNCPPRSWHGKELLSNVVPVGLREEAGAGTVTAEMRAVDRQLGRSRWMSGGAVGMSFRLSFHLLLLSPTEAHWLDDPSDLTCKDSTQQHAVDDPLLSCNLLSCQERPTTPKPSLLCPAAAFAWSPTPARRGQRTAPSRLPGAGRGGRPTATATESRRAKATDLHRPRAAARPARDDRIAPEHRHCRCDPTAR
jgi:hypothetical protein